MKNLILFLVALSVINSPVAFSCDSESSSCNIDAGAFNKILYYTCSNGDYINEVGATRVAKAVAENRINLDVYKTVFNRTCNIEKAMEVAMGDISNTLSFSAFDKILYYKCSNGGYINEVGATRAAKAVAENRINLDIYKTVFYRTCNIEKAMEISCK